MDLTSNDYREILKFYRKTVPKLKSARKAKVERLIGKKLCSCIKKVKFEISNFLFLYFLNGVSINL